LASGKHGLLKLPTKGAKWMNETVGLAIGKKKKKGEYNTVESRTKS